MKCPKCANDNTDDAQFCGGCGASLNIPQISRATARRREYAGFGRRVAAFILDILTFCVVVIPYYWLSAVLGWNDPGASEMVWIAWVATLIIPLLGVGVYQVRLLTLSGQTVGKRLLGMRIVDARTLERGTFARVFLLREAARLVLLFVPLGKLVDVFAILQRRDGRSIHDLIAGTAVVKILGEERP